MTSVSKTSFTESVIEKIPSQKHHNDTLSRMISTFDHDLFVT